MEIQYKSRRLEKECTLLSAAVKAYGKPMAYEIQARIDEIRAASCVEEMIRYHIGRCHQLKGNRKQQYAVDLIHPYRMIFEKKGNDIQIAMITDILDYH